ncbi:putative lipid II flippase FtsW [Salinibacterium sp. ZJ70]|uniref:putative lipid II flippase FtsW n=1 Tax=Salinibacterium sp. ZJ70 TaxID=2708084 RepID=UPI00174E08C4|nr:putative lipid II flippase FtsW [Salinibacterium sp. ZJ70]
MTTTRPPHPPSSPGPAQPSDARGGTTAVVRLRRIFAADSPDYVLLLGTTVFLVIFGLVMVLSSSSIESRVSDGDFFARATRQAVLAAIGLPLMLIVSRAPLIFWKRWAGPAMITAAILQFLVVATPLGSGDYNRNWLRFGGVSFQPSEAVKLALIIWLALVLTTVIRTAPQGRRLALQIIVFAGGPLFLVLIGNDLGTAIILFSMIIGALFFAGVKLRYIGSVLAIVAIAALILVQVSESRSGRFAAWLSGCADPVGYADQCYQTLHGWQALANGGIFGVGLGNSASKWNWLPEAETDFIYAIIGEELGLVGAVLVIILFAVLAVCFVRIIRRQTDPFVKIATSVAMVWIIGQAFVNIAVVLGLLPVLGVPLPFISAGGSSLVTTLVAIGIVLSFARHDPRAVESVQ